MGFKFAEVAVGVPTDRTFYYSIPDTMRDISVGSFVIVPFAKRKVSGYVLGLADSVDLERTRDIISVVHPDPVFCPESLEFYRSVASRYLAGLGEVIRMAMPPGLKVKQNLVLTIGKNPPLGLLAVNQNKLISHLIEKVAIEEKTAMKKFGLNKEDILGLSRSGVIDLSSGIWDTATKPRYEKLLETAASSAIKPGGKIGKKQMEILRSVEEGGGRIALSLLSKKVRNASAAVRSLEKAGLLKVSAVESERAPFLEESVARDIPPELYPDQAKALGAISRKTEAGDNATFLLYGITGSGKTEVYLRAIENVILKGKNAIALVPEISLTPQFIHRFRARFGEVLSVIHSGMSKGERYDQWRRILSGKTRIVIGARSALFAPLKDIGIIVVDEEHEPSYKQEERIMYNARDMAIERARLSKAVAVLGSATPSLESYHRALCGEYTMLKLSSRTTDHGLPDVEVVDLRKEKGKIGKKGFISEALLDGIRATTARGGKVILFLNRRGYSTFVTCTNCGTSVRCPDCSVSMKYHESNNSLVCHYCGQLREPFGFCETCSSRSLARFGFGTEQIESEIKAHFPDLAVARMDRDTTTRKFSHEIIINRLERGEIDILIGTQMVSKGLDVKKVELVGVVLADISLNIPDFRACERTFSLLTQVAGRSGRGGYKGRVIIQTYNPEHYSILEASKQDYQSFYEKEIRFRKDFGYPPFSRLANIRFSSKDPKLMENSVRKAAKILKNLPVPEGQKDSISILGPSPSPIEKIRGEYRWQILLKFEKGDLLEGYLRTVLAEYREEFRKNRDFSYRIDIDPQNFI